MQRIPGRLVWFSLGALIAVAVFECVLRLLPVSMGLYRTEQFERWPLQSSEPGLPYSYSISWSMQNAHRGKTNNYGHIAPFDFKKDSQPVLVIGDSFVESLMNNYADTLQGQLGRKFEGRQPVYGLGVSGLSASDYVAMARQARDEFAPVAAVLVIEDGDLSESLGFHLGNYFLTPEGNGLKLGYAPLDRESFIKKIRKQIGDISIYRYFQVNLQFSLENVIKVFERNASPDSVQIKPVKNADAHRRVADWLLAELPVALNLPPQCIALLFDSDRYAIYKAGLASPRKDNPGARQYLIEQAQKLGFRSSDLDPVFRQRFGSDNAKFDYWPIDRHWNRLGHGIASEEAHRLLSTPAGRQQSCLSLKQAGQ